MKKELSERMKRKALAGGSGLKSVLDYIDSLKKKIYEDLDTDRAIKADPYDNVARLKVCEKIEKFILKEEKQCR